MKIKSEAERYARFWLARRPRRDVPTWETLRDWLDGKTGGELDCVPLDILTDETLRHIKRLD